MQLFLDTEIKTFLSRAQTYLELQPAVHSMILSLVLRSRQLGNSMPVLASLVNSRGEILAAGVQTDPERNLLISNIAQDVAENFAKLLACQVESLPGVYGPAEAAKAFAKTWTQEKRREPRLIKNLRLFEISELRPPKLPEGLPRQAKPQDQDVILQWYRAFHAEAVPNDPKISDEDLRASVEAGIARGEFFLWQHEGKVTSLVGSRRETERERWIAPVYTPPNLRGRGFGAALTAYASQKILASGKKGMLFTDLANPISNRIYQKIGYVPLSDFQQLSFE